MTAQALAAIACAIALLVAGAAIAAALIYRRGTQAALERAGQRLRDAQRDLALAHLPIPAVGSRVIVNTLKPDDQSLAGVVLAVLTDDVGQLRAIHLGAAELLVQREVRGAVTDRLPTGDVAVFAPSISFVVLDVDAPSPRQALEARVADGGPLGTSSGTTIAAGAGRELANGVGA